MSRQTLLRFNNAAVLAAVLVVSAFARADSTPDVAAPLTPAEARGKIIYTTGRTASGRRLAFRLLSAGDGLLPANGIVCANCHGADGKGAREGNIVMADIRYATLANPQPAYPPRRRARAAYDDALLARAITQGIDPSEHPLEASMPRWVLEDADLRDLLAYLKRLGRD
ncbi:MAG: c-type cytochrome [Sulfurifustis sp.]